MKKATELIAVWGLVAVLIAIIVTLLTGCCTSDCSNSGTAEYPTIERWWK